MSVERTFSAGSIIGNPPTSHQVTVTDPGRYAALRAAADGLPSLLPGVLSCPVDTTRYVVAFTPGTGRPADITYSTGSCGTVTVTVSGGRTGVLAIDQAFVDAYRRALGLPGP